MSESQNTSPPKLAVEKVFEKFKAFTSDVFADVAEPRSLILVVDWQIGQNDFPAGLLVSRDKERQPADLIEISNQINKMNIRLLQKCQHTLSDIENVHKILSTYDYDGKREEIRVLENDIENLKQIKRKLENA